MDHSLMSRAHRMAIAATGLFRARPGNARTSRPGDDAREILAQGPAAVIADADERRSHPDLKFLRAILAGEPWRDVSAKRPFAGLISSTKWPKAARSSRSSNFCSTTVLITLRRHGARKLQ